MSKLLKLIRSNLKEIIDVFRLKIRDGKKSLLENNKREYKSLFQLKAQDIQNYNWLNHTLTTNIISIDIFIIKSLNSLNFEISISLYIFGELDTDKGNSF